MTESKDHARKVEIAEIAAIMKTTGGRNFMARVLQTAGTFDSTYVKDSPDETIRKSIRRDFGLWLQREIQEAAPGEYFILLKEMNDG